MSSLEKKTKTTTTTTRDAIAETIPWSETKCSFYSSRSACVDGKFHVKTSKVVAYNSKEVRWDLVDQEMTEYMNSDCYCVIENVLYSASYGVLRWYDTEVCRWKQLKGVPKLPCGAPIRLADYGGKMTVLWEGKIENDPYDLRHGGCGYKKIWYAEIALERLKTLGKIWGKVEWFDHVRKSLNYVIWSRFLLLLFDE